MKTGEEFIQIIDQIYSLYLDSINSYSFLVNHIDKFVENNRSIYMAEPTNLNEIRLKYQGYLHQGMNFEKLKERNQENDHNMRLIANTIIVTIYQYWEDKYREKFAKERGLSEKDDLKNDLFGELGYLRNSIIHKNGKVNEKLASSKKKYITWFTEKGSIIELEPEKMQQLINLLINEVEKEFV